MNTYYNKKYFDYHLKENPIEKDEYKSMGFAGVDSARPRYDVIQNLIKDSSNTSVITSILDVGAGTGAMWSKYFCKNIECNNLNRLDLMEPNESYSKILKTRLRAIRSYFDSAKIINTDLINFESTIKYDLVVSCGALNYYKLNELLELINKMESVCTKYLIFEVNIQSPITPASFHGNFNPSISSIYDYLCLKYTKIDIKIIRQYTSIWKLSKGDLK